MRRENEDGITFDGKHYTLYEAIQRQRKFERAIRDRKRRILGSPEDRHMEELHCPGWLPAQGRYAPCGACGAAG